MELDGDSHITLRRWEGLPSDIVQKILVESDFDDTSGLTSLISRLHCGAVCSAWRSILSDPQLWNTLDLSTMKSDFIYIHVEPDVYVSEKTDSRLNCILKTSLSLSRRNITTLLFNLNLYVPDHLFTYTAERSPKLKRLVMPVWNRISIAGIRKAIASWKDLESLTIGNINSYNYDFLMRQISTNCKNFSELKLIGTCNFFASALVRYVPKLKVLSLRCSNLLKEDLIAILNGLQDLEVLNISHCVLLNTRPRTRIILTELDPFILGKAFRLRRFITCMKSESCVMCQRAREDEGIMRWYRYEEGLWKVDEVDSLAL
ncbi:F-box/LRR-repeat protein At3g48880-like [Rosa rugosa]|uniref:F-box/LRR-repeat protein At3g48880-like n=1 Tax=Rosa rugosa TaxID=74645 RepID=UPI002B404959|nr:F-box/LRR-repeat protein At3g48880-like [Rosa rugosa]